MWYCPLPFFSYPVSYLSMKIFDWKFLLLACLTLGLAPFFPEPHILGKLKWIAGGAVGMQPLDWFDAIFHGAPWLLMIGFLIGKAIQIRKPAKS